MRSPSRRSPRVLIILLLLLTLPPAALRAAEAARATLDNGMQVVVVPNRLAPVATVMVNYRAGTNQDPDEHPGLAHALEHMMFRGTPELSAGQLAAIMAALGGQFNAATRQTATQYFATVPAEELEVVLRLEADRMKELHALERFEELWQKERGALLQEVAMRISSPMHLFYVRLLEQMYAGTPYARTGLGTREAFLRMDGETLKRFHQTWYAPNNAILVIAGDVDPETAMEAAGRTFGKLEFQSLPERAKPELHPLEPAVIAMETDQPYGLAISAYRLPGYDDPDYAAGLVLADVLASQRGELHGLVPAGEALFAGFSVHANPPASVAMAAAAFPKGGDGKELVARVQKIIAAARENGLPAELVAAAKRQAVANAEFRKNSVMGQAMLWSEALAIEGRTSPEELVAAIERVTPADVNRVARQYLVNETATTAVLTPRPAGEPRALDGSPLPGPESYAPQEVQQVTLPPWAERAQAARLLRPAAAPADLRLENGLRLIVLPLDLSPTVSLFGRVENNPDLQVVPGQEGVDQVLAELFSHGTKELDRLSFRMAVDEIAARLAAGTDFSLKVLAEHFDRGVELLAANPLAPALPEQAFEVVRRQTAGVVAGELESPDFLARQAVREALFPEGDPSLRHATPATVQGLTIEQVKEYHRRVFRPDLTTIVVIGRLTPEQARGVIEKRFGAWRATGPTPQTHYPAVPPSEATARRIPDPSRVQDQVILAQTVPVTRSSPDYYPLQLGRHILAGGFYATRLFRDLREETGLVYSVSADLQAGKHRTILEIGYGSDPEDVAEAQAIVVRNLQVLQREPVPEPELRQARNLLLRQIPLNRSSVDGTARLWLDLVRLELPLDEPQHAAKRYLAISAHEVQEAFARHLRPGELARIIKGPPLAPASE